MAHVPHVVKVEKVYDSHFQGHPKKYGYAYLSRSVTLRYGECQISRRYSGVDLGHPLNRLLHGSGSSYFKDLFLNLCEPAQASRSGMVVPVCVHP